MMTAFSLKIMCPDGVKFDGQAQSLTIRATTGDMGILAGHANCIASLGMGPATVIADETVRHAVCEGGLVRVMNGAVTMLPRTFEWASK